MAGLGETYTHVGAVLHAIVKQEQRKTVTVLQPVGSYPALTKQEPKVKAVIDLTSAKSKKKKINYMLSHGSPPKRKREKNCQPSQRAQMKI